MMISWLDVPWKTVVHPQWCGMEGLVMEEMKIHEILGFQEMMKGCLLEEETDLAS